jgi:hypothetical protein
MLGTHGETEVYVSNEELSALAAIRAWNIVISLSLRK